MKTKTIFEFDTLVANHSKEIYAYLWRMFHNRQDAEDAFQDTFLRAFRAYPRLLENSNQRAWLYKIATNVAYTHLKRRSRTLSRTTDLTVLLAADEKVPHDVLMEVLAAVEALPEKQRAALILRNYQGLAYPEIGTALDCSPDSARANVYQAIKKLRSQFKKEIP
ncbi:MAG: RNA polymerase sigma factor [Anaerolineales bacterium]|nr:RNA polymerase sigma factor [Anaerolineales bacterium]